MACRQSMGGWGARCGLQGCRAAGLSGYLLIFEVDSVSSRRGCSGRWPALSLTNWLGRDRGEVATEESRGSPQSEGLRV